MVRHELHVCRLPTIEAVLKGLCRKEGEGIDGVGDGSKVQSSARCKALRMHFCFTSQSGNVHRELEERHTTNAIDSLNGRELVAGDDLDSQSRWHMLRRGRLPRHPVTTVPIFRVAVVPHSTVTRVQGIPIGTAPIITIIPFWVYFWPMLS
jgi:hypothetical protein